MMDELKMEMMFLLTLVQAYLDVDYWMYSVHIAHKLKEK